MTDRPSSVTAYTPLSQVAELMQSEDVGVVPVVAGDQLLGIVTDRDIVVRVIAKGRDPREVSAADAASQDLVTVTPDEDLGDALKLMAQYQVRRLPVVGEDNRLLGAVPQAD